MSFSGLFLLKFKLYGSLVVYSFNDKCKTILFSVFLLSYIAHRNNSMYIFYEHVFSILINKFKVMQSLGEYSGHHKSVFCFKRNFQIIFHRDCTSHQHLLQNPVVLQSLPKIWWRSLISPCLNFSISCIKIIISLITHF